MLNSPQRYNKSTSIQEKAQDFVCDKEKMNKSSSWSIYSSRDGESEGPWRSSTSMNAISFGFVATAILISMFLIMAIFEHLFRAENSSFDSPHRITQRQRDGSSQFQKLADQASMVNSNTQNKKLLKHFSKEFLSF